MIPIRRGFFPYVVLTLRNIPIIGNILNIYPFKQVFLEQYIYPKVESDVIKPNQVADYIINEGEGLPV